MPRCVTKGLVGIIYPRSTSASCPNTFLVIIKHHNSVGGRGERVSSRHLVRYWIDDTNLWVKKPWICAVFFFFTSFVLSCKRCLVYPTSAVGVTDTDLQETDVNHVTNSPRIIYIGRVIWLIMFYTVKILSISCRVDLKYVFLPALIGVL